MNDLISRQTAIKNYQRVCRKVACNDCPFLIRITETLTDCELERFLHDLPSAQPEPKTAQWIDFSMSIKGVPTEACGNCGEWSYGMGKHYCPNCGYRMMEVEHEQDD